MSEALAIADMDTDTLEAALFGGGEPAQPVEQEGGQVTDEVVAEEVTTPEVTEEVDVAEDAPLQDDEPDSGASDEVTDEPVSEEPEAVSDDFVLQRGTLVADEARALELRQRNPDMTLDAALHMARTQLGYYNEDGTTRPEELTIEHRVEELEAKLAEAGANDGLFTTEIADLTKQHARLCAELAVQRSEVKRNDETKAVEGSMKREESYQRARTMFPDALDSKTPLGKALLQVISEAESSKNPLLFDHQAPELFVALANARLPENLRVEMKRPTPLKREPSSGVLARGVPSEAGPSPGNVLPVRATARTAQPNNVTQMDPTNVGRAIKEMPTDDLEAALLGEKGSTALLRL